MTLGTHDQVDSLPLVRETLHPPPPPLLLGRGNMVKSFYLCSSVVPFGLLCALAALREKILLRPILHRVIHPRFPKVLQAQLTTVADIYVAFDHIHNMRTNLD